MARYAFADIHGRMDILKKIIDKIKPGDVVYCLGDCGDRGPDSWECIKTVLAHPQIIYLKGNHEDMLVKAFRSAMMGD
jgi:serine/threonine protein phosphatase 1